MIDASENNNSSPLRGEDVTPKLEERRVTGGGKYKKPFSVNTQQNAKSLRNRLTEAEKKLWYFLRNKQMGVKFRRQQPVGLYIADFLSFEATLIIELDGGQHSDNFVYDKERDNFLQKEGFTVLRFWNDEVMKNIDGVLQIISSHLAHPLLTSPLKGEEKEGEAA